MLRAASVTARGPIATSKTQKPGAGKLLSGKSGRSLNLRVKTAMTRWRGYGLQCGVKQRPNNYQYHFEARLRYMILQRF